MATYQKSSKTLALNLCYSVVSRIHVKHRCHLHFFTTPSSDLVTNSVSARVQWVWQKLPHVKERRTKDLLISALASALYYNPALTVSLLQQQNQLPPFLTTWGKVSRQLMPCLLWFQVLRIGTARHSCHQHQHVCCVLTLCSVANYLLMSLH